MGLPLLYATVCYLRRRDKTLFIDYRDFPHPLHQGKFAPPGGKIKLPESSEQAVRREIKEETGINLNTVRYKGEVLFLNVGREFNEKPAKYNFLVYFFESDDFDDSQARATEGKLAWINNTEIRAYPMHKTDIGLLDLFLSNKFIKAEVINGLEVRVIEKS